MKRFVALVAMAITGLVGAGSASAEDSFTFGDAAVLGPVHVRGDVAEVHTNVCFV